MSKSLPTTSNQEYCQKGCEMCSLTRFCPCLQELTVPGTQQVLRKCRDEGEQRKPWHKPACFSTQQRRCLSEPFSSCACIFVSSPNTMVICSSLPFWSDYTLDLIQGIFLLLTRVWWGVCICVYFLPKMCFSLFIKQCTEVLPVIPH